MDQYTETPFLHDQLSDANVTTAAVPDDFVSDADVFPHHEPTAAEEESHYQWAMAHGLVPAPQAPPSRWHVSASGERITVEAKTSDAALRKARRQGFHRRTRGPITVAPAVA